MMNILLSGLLLTAQIFVTTLVGALPLGVVVALCRMSRFKPLALLTRFYISVMRGTPLMLQLMALMFGPYYLFGLQMGQDWKYFACAIGFIVNYAAYFAEIYRSGIQSIPPGQYEAAAVLGYSRVQTFMKIVLPQVIKRILPAMGNEIITLVKDTSLAFVLGIMEMFSQAKALAASQVSMVPYLVAGADLLGVQPGCGNGAHARGEEAELLSRLRGCCRPSAGGLARKRESAACMEPPSYRSSMRGKASATPPC